MEVTDRLFAIGTRNEDLPKLATNPQFAKQWIETNYLPYTSVLDIIVGNEVILEQCVVPAIRNLRGALDQFPKPKVTVMTAIHAATLANSFPPWSTVFASDSINVMTDLVQYFASLPPGHKSNLYIHAYPHFAHAGDYADVSIDFVLFKLTKPKVQEGGLAYTNLFDAMYDGFVWAWRRLGVVISD